MGIKIEYGNTYEQARQGLSVPKTKTESWGKITYAAVQPEFQLFRFDFSKDGCTEFPKGTLFIEKGRLSFAGRILKQGSVLDNMAGLPYNFTAEPGSIAYVFTDHKITSSVLRTTSDQREKYWGKIETIVSNDKITGKRIFMKANSQSSLEYHVRKKECYFLQEGKLKIGVRVGRAENKSVILEPGSVFIIHPGLMHMRICLEDCVIIEISTKDEDSDSHLVEDGQKYIHKEA